MNFIFDIKDFNIEKIHLFEKKKNIVIDGIFTKIVYSDELLTMNGIYFDFPLEFKNGPITYNNRNIHFYPYEPANLEYIKDFSRIEENIIHYYKYFYNINKKSNLALTNQLYSGFFKIYREPSHLNERAKYILKISGIWENKTEVGITYKIIEMHETFT